MENLVEASILKNKIILKSLTPFEFVGMILYFYRFNKNQIQICLAVKKQILKLVLNSRSF